MANEHKKYSLIKTVFSSICMIGEGFILTFLLFVCIALALPSLPIDKYMQTYVVPTGSMTPVISVGSLAFVNPRDTAVGWGDIVAYINPKNKKMTVIHRIIGQKEEKDAVFYKTKGDNNNDIDPWLVPHALIKGKLLFTIPYGGYLMSYTKSTQGFYLAIVAPSLVLILLEFKKIAEGIEAEVEKRTQERIKQYFFVPKFLIILLLFLFLPGLSSSSLANSSFVSKITIDDMRMIVKKSDQPALQLSLSGEHAVVFSLDNIAGFNKAVYTLTYDTDTTREGVQGEATLEGNSYESPEIVLGTCSSGGTCVYDRGIRNLKLTVTVLSSDDKYKQTLKTSL